MKGRIKMILVQNYEYDLFIFFNTTTKYYFIKNYYYHIQNK